MAQSAAQLHRRAVALSMREQYAQAAHALDLAESRATSVDTRARILGTRAVILQRTGRPDDAERVCRSALDLPGTTDETHAALLGQLGVLAMYGGRAREASQWLTDAIGRMKDDTVECARIRVNRSIVEMQLNEFAEAVDDLDHAIETFRRHSAEVECGQALHNRAYVRLIMGDLVGALEGMHAARPLAGTTPVTVAIGDTDRAEALRDAGLTSEAEQVLASVAPVFGRHRMPQSRAEAEFQLARSQLSHDAPAAARTAAIAAKRFRALGTETWATRADGIRMRARLAPPRQMEPRRRRAVDAAEVDAVASALDAFGFANEAAALRYSLDIWRSHRKLPHPAPLARIPRTASLDVRLLAHEARAARATAAGQDAAVRRHAAAGLAELSEWQRTFGSLDLQTSVSMHGSGLILAGLDAAVRSRRPAVVFEWSERARHLSQQVVPLRPPPDPELAGDLAQLRALRADGVAAGPRADALRERARQRQWSGTGAAGIHQRADLAELAAELDADTAQLTYVYSGSALSALVVTDHGARLFDLPDAREARDALPGLRADLDMAATVTGPMARVVRRSLDERLAWISRAILDGPLRAVTARRIVLTAPGVLSGIPWALLPGMRGRVFTLTPSASRWLRTRPAARYEAVGLVSGPHVVRGEAEVDAAAAAWRADSARIGVLRGPEAVVPAVTTLAGDVDVLHVAAHGRHVADTPMFSALELADGPLYGYDVDQIAHVPEVVVLSACEAGRSSVRWGEEAVGMTRVWLHAGARAVVATPVIVADDAACELLGAMHTGLATGLGASEALAQAAIETGIVAPFQVYGSGF